MDPFLKPLEEITEDDLNSLKSNKVSESKTLDYKRDTYGPKDSDKKEFAKDISSFANTSGGCIIIGVDEDMGVPTAVDGISIDPEAEILRLDAVAKTGINPRILRLPMRAIPLENGKFVIIIQIPNSWNSPHMVTYKGHNRFYARNSSGKYELDVDELRTAFTLSTSIAERVRNFRVDRISKIMAGDTPATIDLVNPTLVLHIVPLAGTSRRQTLDMRTFQPGHGEDYCPLSHPSQHRFNLDGVLYYMDQRSGGVFEYCQIFRDGSIEFVFPNIGTSDPPVLNPSFENVTIAFLRNAESLIGLVSDNQPYFAMLTLLRVKDCSIERIKGVHFPHVVPNRIDRDLLILPEIVANDLETNFPTMMRPSFDAVWNAAGFATSLQYDNDDNWRPDTR